VNGLDATSRSQVLDELERGVFDIAVIGGGITGAGVAREASLRGLRVALVEAEDYASGTSSRSSKLIHGGLRYLAMGDVALVRETALERTVLRRMAPHLAERRWMVLPVRTRAGLLKFRTAITAYEKLGAVATEDTHRKWDAADLEREEPLLDRSRFPHACAYREYLTDDARLVLANLRAAAAAGAVCLNHVPVDAFLASAGGRAEGLTARCDLSQRRVAVRACCIVNAAGPWVEAIRRFEDPSAADLLHLSKGVHVVLPASRCPVRNVVLMNAGDKRSLFAIPRGDVTYVGTTDTTYAGGARVWPEITAEDVRYLLEPIGRTFAVEPPQPAEIVAGWAGLRPLVARPGKAPQDLSRKDEVTIGPAGIVTVAGGKLTGYRPMAIRIVECAGGVIGGVLPPRPADEPPLPGGDFDGDSAALERQLVASFAVGASAARRLVGLYGSEAAACAELGVEPLVAGTGVLAGEVVWAVRHEGATRAEDVLYRRTRVALYHPAWRESLVEPVVAQMALLLGWDAGRCAEERARVRDLFRSEQARLSP
jgi:glycerol-3-phosphate dehydrogenase